LQKTRGNIFDQEKAVDMYLNSINAKLEILNLEKKPEKFKFSSKKKLVKKKRSW